MEALEARLKALMLRGLGGDAAAHGALLTELGRLLRAYYGRRLHAAADVEDLVQEALIAVHTRRETYDPAQPFTAWAYAVARYKMIDYFRRKRLRPSAPLEEAEALFVGDGGEAATAPADLARLLAELPAGQAAAIRATRLEGLSVAEAAAATGQSQALVKVNVHRGLKTLMARVSGATP